MSEKRQLLPESRDSPLRRPWRGPGEGPLAAHTRDLRAGDEVAAHRHDRGQLVYAATGVMRVETAAGAWVVPPAQAVWLPAGAVHRVTCIGGVALRSVFIRPEAAAGLPLVCRVVAVSALLRELVLAAMELPARWPADGPEARLVKVLIDRLREAPEAGLRLPVPADRRLDGIVGRLMADPSDDRSLAAWAREAGASARTLARLFLRETGLTFGAWRKRLRLQEALARLAVGEAVTSVALAVGYDSPSAFIAMFRDSMGETPGRYLEPDRAAARSGMSDGGKEEKAA